MALGHRQYDPGQPRPEDSRDLGSPLPPLPEQKRIAEALSDADELIVGLERLIAKKQAIKQGMMQQLLTGQTRLPGFTEEWVHGTFEQIASPSSERVKPRGGSSRRLLCIVELDQLEVSGLGDSVRHLARFGSCVAQGRI